MSTLINSLRGAVIAAILAVAGLAVVPLQAYADTELNLVDGVAVHGYDVVAYFTQGKPVEGNASITASHDGAVYRFSSAENRDLFAADPAKYAPQYGGYCAFGTAMGRKFDGDPQAWRIVDGKLYLNLNKQVQSKWKENIPGFIRGANNNWPLIRSVADKVLETTPPAGLSQGAL